MPGLLRAAIGGAVAGLGKGLAEQVEQDGITKRMERLAELQNQLAMARDDRQNAFTDEQRRKSETFQVEQKGVEFGRQKELKGIELENDLKKIDRTYAGKAGLLNSAGGGMTAAEAREFDRLEELYADNPAGLRDALANHPNTRLRSLVERGGGASGTVNQDTWAKAEERARKEAGDRAGWFSTDGADFKDDGGSREEFITRRSKEIYGEMTGRGAAGPGQPAQGQKPSASGSTAQEAPPAPRDPAQRKVGQAYTAPDGRRVEWTGKGWRAL